MDDNVYKFEISMIWNQIFGFIKNNTKFIFQLCILFAAVYVLDSVFSLYFPSYNNFTNSSKIGFLNFNSVDLSKLLSVDGFLSFILKAFIFFLEVMISAMLFRKFLFNEYSGFYGLRFGHQEIIIGFLFLIAALFINFFNPLFKLADTYQEPMNLGGLIIVAIIMLYISLRFYVTMPLFLSENKIDFIKAWQLSKNNAWNFFGLCIFSALIILGLSVIIQAFLILMALLFGFERHIISPKMLTGKLFVENAHPYFIGFSKLIYNISIDVLKAILDVLIPVYAYNRIIEISKHNNINHQDLQTA